MITRTTTVGSLKSYRYDLNRSNNTMNKRMNTVLTQRTFNSYAEDPAMATRCFQLRRAFQRTASQLTVNDSLRHKYDVAWSAKLTASQDIYAMADDTSFGSIIRGANGADASGRNALGQSLTSKAKDLVQIMNGRYGENYVFGGADTLNVPFTWEPEENPVYIAAPDGTNADHAAAFQYMADPAKVADGTLPEGTLYTNDPTLANQVTVDGNQVPEENKAYNDSYPYKYLKEDGTPTNSAKEAKSVLCFRGVRVDSNAEGDIRKMEVFLKETKYVDIGLGHKERDGEAVSSSVFNSALQGVYYTGGYGTTDKIEVTLSNGNTATVEDVPQNLINIIDRLGTILQRCDPDNGNYASEEDEAEARALFKQFEDHKDLYIQRWTELDTETGFLRDNSELLTNTADSLSQQFMALEDEDPAAAISAYMFARYCYDTALKVGNSILSQSLMDYINL